ncbi:MAG: hypothetical protein ACPLKQ_00620 [Candidatus Bathyarchaeales archaeon]
MTKGMRKTGLLLLLCFLAVSAQQWIQAKATSSDVTDDAELGQRILLTNDEIKARWPNLPTAEEIYGKEVCVVIDLRYCVKQAPSIYGYYICNGCRVWAWDLVVVNCTMNVPDFLHGGIIRDVPQIWLKYNESIWVAVPLKYLMPL